MLTTNQTLHFTDLYRASELYPRTFICRQVRIIFCVPDYMYCNHPIYTLKICTLRSSHHEYHTEYLILQSQLQRTSCFHIPPIFHPNIRP
ncbi:hypothetical protein EYC84_004695 [Monilinia fructicola]|uniref:Uncharacterized protein n=1 Tax=Monilinia fructicola TaxID=38448 RepID=A0A5M9K188_MONFR|nr:hypothetical protein EYC84_004695 [Monilinia fructicola]